MKQKMLSLLLCLSLCLGLLCSAALADNTRLPIVRAESGNTEQDKTEDEGDKPGDDNDAGNSGNAEAPGSEELPDSGGAGEIITPDAGEDPDKANTPEEENRSESVQASGEAQASDNAQNEASSESEQEAPAANAAETAGTTEVQIRFSDVPETFWAFDYISKLASSGVVTGYADGSYLPENTVTRAEFLALTVRTICGETLETVSGPNWWQPVYTWALDNHLISDLEFPAESSYLNTPITRYEAAKLLSSASNAILATSGLNETDGLTDLDADQSYYVESCVRRGLITGYTDGTFGGERTLTRAEAATIITRLQAKATLPEDFYFVASWGDTWLLQCFSADGTELRLINMLTGETLQSMELPMDMDIAAEAAAAGLDSASATYEEELANWMTYRHIYLTISERTGDYFYGQAGLFVYENGVLTRLYEGGVCSVTENGDSLLLVARPVGTRDTYTGAAVQNDCGNMVVQLSADGTATVLLDSEPDLILNLTNAFVSDGVIYVESSSVMGMSDWHTYLYRLGDGRLYAMTTEGIFGYADRTQEEADAEQARLDALYAS